jgi:hypothetical protein
MTASNYRFAKILFCDVHLICNLATEFNGLVSKQDWLFPRPVLFIFGREHLLPLTSKILIFNKLIHLFLFSNNLIQCRFPK